MKFVDVAKEEGIKNVEDRGLEGSYSYNGKKYQVMCGCNDDYLKQKRKTKTRPMLIADIDKKYLHKVYCGICKMAPHIILNK